MRDTDRAAFFFFAEYVLFVIMPRRLIRFQLTSAFTGPRSVLRNSSPIPRSISITVMIHIHLARLIPYVKKHKNPLLNYFNAM